MLFAALKWDFCAIMNQIIWIIGAAAAFSTQLFKKKVKISEATSKSQFKRNKCASLGSNVAKPVLFGEFFSFISWFIWEFISKMYFNKLKSTEFRFSLLKELKIWTNGEDFALGASELCCCEWNILRSSCWQNSVLNFYMKHIFLSSFRISSADGKEMKPFQQHSTPGEGPGDLKIL